MIKTLLKSVREYKVKSIITVIFTATEVLLECFIPFIMAMLIDSIEKESITTLIAYGVALISLAFASLYCGIMAGRFAATAACGFAKNIRHDLYYSIQEYGFEDVDKFSQSSLVTRLTTDVSNVQMAYQMCMRIVIRVPLMIIFSFIMIVSFLLFFILTFLRAQTSLRKYTRGDFLLFRQRLWYYLKKHVPAFFSLFFVSTNVLINNCEFYMSYCYIQTLLMKIDDNIEGNGDIWKLLELLNLLLLFFVLSEVNLRHF